MPVGFAATCRDSQSAASGADIIILDEPSAVLTPLEVKELLANMRSLAKLGKTFVIITHKLQEVMDVADRITVLRDGQVTGILEAKDTNVEELSRLMVGRELVRMDKPASTPGEPVLQVEGVHLSGAKDRSALIDIQMQVRKGEVVGIAGISGNGQSELIQVIAGLRKPDGGRVLLSGQDTTNWPVRRIREHGLAHIPEDRYMWGAAKDASVKENGLMGHHHRLQKRV